MFARRHAVAAYAATLLAAGRIDEAVTQAMIANQTVSEDVRSGVYATRVLARALAAAGRHDEARVAADAAVRAAYGTQQISERAAADRVRALLTSTGSDATVA